MLPQMCCACGAILSLVAMCSSAVAAEAPAVRVRFSMADPADDSPVTVKVSGKILNARTEQPIPGALVRGHVFVGRFYSGPEKWSKMPYQETRSDDHGAYVLRFVTPLSTSGPSATRIMSVLMPAPAAMKPGR